MKRSFAHAVAASLMGAVGRLAPQERRDWVRGMSNEFAYLPEGLPSLGFAAGCVWAAVHLQIALRCRGARADVLLGSLVGTAFFVHAAIPGSHAWPLIWPVLGGAAAASMLREGTGSPSTRSAGKGAKVGAVAATVFVIGGVGLLAWLEQPDLQERAAILILGAGFAIAISAFTASLTAALTRPKAPGAY
jgi:hypothetical protein